MSIKKLAKLVEKVKGLPKMRVSVAAGEDPHTIEAVARGVNEGMIDATMTGHASKIKKVASEYDIDPSIFNIVDTPDEKTAAVKAVEIVNAGDADFLMKGLVGSATYMRAILNKEKGLLPPKSTLSHVTILEVPSYHKLLIGTDVAVLIAPDLGEKVAMIGYAVDIAHRLDIERPKVAVIGAVEKVNPKMCATVEAAVLTQMNRRGQIKGCVVDGPLAMDLAVSKESREIKGVDSEVAGDADVLVFPDIEAGNIFYKACAYLAEAKLAAIVTGAKVPCVLTSRADSEDSKFYSIALAALMAGKGK
ncbi:bifunctional enoyl-CoA hydratase/phosphate acetyltransferase [candidate division WOR-3 bacterium]|uniref:Bifunctional enoyl-CoA hydratase/phosphate acetyltransferase n=1 Tax=candidate division WOR-3 bacterium TaxID=2052148 RepID=A0A9D5QD02_UNCW3|nr:bifunctional enoyl-CoA hydratase/phosphate acetyltransferase [candidate division WOR-3 bacterium]MBD3364587.1 bifunctional enoyl-CoA hydratase/phosphate acetyltransferase [candidate division WOR-3 bacterium]